jgi:hypothetical protein
MHYTESGRPEKNPKKETEDNLVKWYTPHPSSCWEDTCLVKVHATEN